MNSNVPASERSVPVEVGLPSKRLYASFVWTQEGTFLLAAVTLETAQQLHFGLARGRMGDVLATL